MMSDHRNEEEIQTIVRKGMSDNDRFYRRLFKLYQMIGFRHLFYDAREALFLVLSVLLFMPLVAVLFAFMQEASATQTLPTFSLLFMGTPFYFYAHMLLFVALKMEQPGVEVEQATRFSLVQLIALRTLVIAIFSLIGIILFVVFANELGVHIPVLQGLAIASSGLFLFASIYLTLMTTNQKKWLWHWGFPILWIAMTVGLYLLPGVPLEGIIQLVPTGVYTVLAITSFYYFYSQIQELFDDTKQKGEA